MPLVYTKNEIKSYLNRRGFDISNEEVIDKFIHDLKKMIKHENRQRRRERLGHEPNITNETTAPEDHKSSIRQKMLSRDQVNGLLRSEEEEDSIDNDICYFQKVVRVGGCDRKTNDYEHQQQTNLCSVENYNPKGEKNRHSNRRDNLQEANLKSIRPSEIVPHKSSVAVDSGRRPPIPKSDIVTMRLKTFTHQSNEVPKIEESLIEIGYGTRTGNLNYQNRPKTSTASLYRNDFDPTANYLEKETVQRNLHRPSSAHHIGANDEFVTLDDTNKLLLELDKLLGVDDFEDVDSESVSTRRTIRGPPNSVKTDPVLLYHYYKNIWDKLKIPGENRHMQLRWNVRAQTEGNYPCFNGKPVKYLRK